MSGDYPAYLKKTVDPTNELKNIMIELLFLFQIIIKKKKFLKSIRFLLYYYSLYSTTK